MTQFLSTYYFFAYHFVCFESDKQTAACDSSVLVEHNCQTDFFRYCVSLFCFRKNALQPRIEQQLELSQLTIQFSLAELLFGAYVGTSWLQSSPCPSRFLDLSVMDDVFNKASSKCDNWFAVYSQDVISGMCTVTIVIIVFFCQEYNCPSCACIL